MARVERIGSKYPQMDFCDAALVRISEMFPHAKVITTDSSHFTIYRRFGNKPLPLIHPAQESR
jgi:hypothetical protein